jgi:hypothetical protein
LAAAVLLVTSPVDGLENGAARRPPLGWSQWNAFGMHFNASLFREMGAAMAANGLQKAGYTLINVGGNGHAVHSAIGHDGRPLNCTTGSAKGGCYIAARNSTGHYQIDPARFPGPGSNETCLDDTKLTACLAAKSAGVDTGDGPAVDPADCGCVNGNEGMRRLADELREMGYQWGSYSAMGGCENEACNIPALKEAKAQGFVRQDYELFVEEWGSAYVMVDSVGDRDPQPVQEVNGSQGKYLLDEWSRLVSTAPPGPLPSGAGQRTPVVLHSCHVACSANYFSGPTLLAAPCNDSDPRQLFELVDGPNRSGFLSEAGTGLCAGCLHVNNGCGNTALAPRSPGGYNASGLGLGLQACANGSAQASFYFDPEHGMIQRSAGPRAPPSCLGLAIPTAPQVVEQPHGACIAGTLAVTWSRGPVVTPPLASSWRPNRTLLRSAGRHGYCLAAGPIQAVPPDPWCTSTVNMWRSNTDSLQVWGRMMDELESLVGLGTVSRPGSWGFPDYLQLGVPMVGSLTWEESKSLLSIWCVCSSPLIISNDVRHGRVQQRVLDLFLNPTMLTTNQQYNGFAGDRLWTAPYGQELWGKPLVNHSAAVVLFNRDGEACTDAAKFNPWHRNVSCGNGGFKCSVDQPIDSPCTDDPTLSTGAQHMTLDFSLLPPAWLGVDSGGEGSSHGVDSGGEGSSHPAARQPLPDHLRLPDHTGCIHSISTIARIHDLLMISFLAYEAS